MYSTDRTKEQITAQHNRAEAAVLTGGSQWPAMSYEEGVAAALGWILGDDDIPPMEED